jgi:GTP cyclohydrolase I
MVKFIDDFPDAKESNGEATELSTHRINEDEEVNSTRNAGFIEGEGHKKKRKNKDRRSKDGERRPPSKKRRHSLSKAARDPRDEASPVEPDVGTRSPSPVIDFDGLSRPSKVPASIQ